MVSAPVLDDEPKEQVVCRLRKHAAELATGLLRAKNFRKQFEILNRFERGLASRTMG